MMDYKSPISVAQNITNKIIKEEEDYILQAVVNVGVNVDREELIKALDYDRKQYEKGYNDALKGSIPIEWIEQYMNKFQLYGVCGDEYCILHNMLCAWEWEKENEHTKI